MPAYCHSVRVFISSTFLDMHAERDHLVTVVFPELRERVEQLGLEFFDVDLRWGVPAKDLNGETANSWEYCRQWIDRVEPFFVCILGQRYGWVPEPHHFRDDADRQRQQREPRSITDLEVRHAVLDTRRKRRSYFYLRATPVPEPNTEYVDPPEYQGRLQALKTAVRQCGRPVRNYSPAWTGQGFVGLKEFGGFILEDLWSGVLRDERYVPKAVWRQVLNADPDTDPRYTDESQPVPPELWEKIVALAKPPPQDPLDAERQQMEAFAASRLRWFQGRTHELQQLADFIHSTAENAPRLAVVAAAPGQGKSALIAKLWQEITQPTLTRPNGHPLPSGGRGAGGEGLFVIAHFVGATERSANAHTLVQRLLDELDRSGIEWPPDEQKEGEEPKRDFNSLCNQLANRLRDYAGDRHIVILLDALNQLTDGHDLHWLPWRLGPSVRVVVSCVDDSSSRTGVPPVPLSPEARVLRALTSRQPAPLRVPLEPLTKEDVRTIVVEYLKEYCKELDREHVDAICRMEQAKNPLYLLVMLGELRTLGGNDMNRIVGERIAALAHDYPDTVSLFRWVLQRLEVFGAEAVRWWCLYLAHGRVGMASHELADLLARKLGANASATALLIERGLRRYLLRRGGQLDFFHGQLRQAAMEQYGSQAEATAVHREMADYFTVCAKGSDPQKEWETDSVRGFAECVFHLKKAGQHEQAAGLLSNFPFLLHKLRVGLLEGVFEDYDMVRREAPAEVVRRLEIWADFFREKRHILRRRNEEWPAHKILLQLAIEHADDSPLTSDAERWLAESRCDWLWLRRVTRIQHARKEAWLAVLEGHSDNVNGALLLPDGRILSWSEDKTLRLWDSRTGKCLALLKGHSENVRGALLLPDGKILSWSGGFWRTSEDNTLRIWDSNSGTSLAVLEGHSRPINGALFLSNGRILSWASDDTLRLWDPNTGKSLAVLEGHSRHLKGALPLPDGRILSWSEDSMRLWDPFTGKSLVVFEEYLHPVRGAHSVRGARALTDGQILSWSIDTTLRLWDPNIGKCLTLFEGHVGWVTGALTIPDGKILSWSEDKTLRLWDSKTGKCLALLKGHSENVLGALLLSAGKVLSWSGGYWRTPEDNTLRIWDGDSGTCLEVLEGHSRPINGALLLSNGKILSWSEDKTLRLWEPNTGNPLGILEGHSREVNGVLAFPDGGILSWSKDHTLRFWDTLDGRTKPRFELEGHPGPVAGALALPNARILSWAWDKTLRLWDSNSGNCIAVLEGHSDRIIGALILTSGRILSWSEDKTLRLWDANSRACLAVLEGHTARVSGAIELADGRVVSWSHGDNLLRIWDCHTGVCRLVLKGHLQRVHGPGIAGALQLADGRLISWSESKWDNDLRVWDTNSGECLMTLRGHSEELIRGALELENGQLLTWWEPEESDLWLDADHTVLFTRYWDTKTGACLSEDINPISVPDTQSTRAQRAACLVGRFRATQFARTLHLEFLTATFPNIARWDADENSAVRCLLPDGTAVVTQDNGQVCILKLHHGNRRISLAEAEELLRSQGRIKKEE